MSITTCGKLDEIEMALGRFELLVDDYERAAHAAEIADDIKIATLVSSRLLALREHVDLNQNTLDAWSDVARMVRNHVKNTHTHNSTGCTQRC